MEIRERTAPGIIEIERKNARPESAKWPPLCAPAVYLCVLYRSAGHRSDPNQIPARISPRARSRVRGQLDMMQEEWGRGSWDFQVQSKAG